MDVIHHTMLPQCCGDGWRRQTVADAALVAVPFVVQVQRIEAGAASAAEIAAAARIVIALEGGGKVIVDGDPQRFCAPCTLRIGAASRYRFVNNTAAPLQLVTVYAAPDDPEDLQR